HFLDEAAAAEVWGLWTGEAAHVPLFDAEGNDLGSMAILRRAPDASGLDRYVCALPAERSADLVWLLGALSNGLVLFDPSDPWAKIDGPVALSTSLEALAPAEADAMRTALASRPSQPDLEKPYFVGQRALATRGRSGTNRAEWRPTDAVERVASPIRADAAIGQAPDGWTMPLHHGDPAAELKALTDAVGLVDESALGVLEIVGPDARRFLDLMSTNNV